MTKREVKAAFGSVGLSEGRMAEMELELISRFREGSEPITEADGERGKFYRLEPKKHSIKPIIGGISAAVIALGVFGVSKLIGKNPPITSYESHSVASPMEMIGLEAEENGKAVVAFDGWELSEDYDLFRKYFFGTWYNEDIKKPFGKLIIDDSEKAYLANQQTFYFDSFYKVSDNVFAFTMNGNATCQLFWIDTENPDIMYHAELAYSNRGGIIFGYDSTVKPAEYNKTDLDINQPQNGYLSVYRLRELSESRGIPMELLTDIGYTPSEGAETLFHDAKFCFYPVYLTENAPDRLVLNTSVGSPMTDEMVDVSYTIEKKNGEWVRTFGFNIAVATEAYSAHNMTDSEISEYKSKFAKACCSDGTALTLTSDGKVITWGWNFEGKIGNGEKAEISEENLREKPFIIDFVEYITDIGASANNCYAVGADGGVYVWGRNGFGESGIPAGNLLSPRRLDIIEPVAKVVMGNCSALFLTRGGEVLTSGIDVLNYRNHEELAENVAYEVNENGESVPIITAEAGYRSISLPFRCVDISVGELHYAFLSDTGEVYVIGNIADDYGITEPVLCYPELTKLDFPEKITAVASGQNSVAAVGESGSVYLCGQKNSSACFDESTDTEASDYIFRKGGLSDIVSVYCRNYCTVAVDKDGNAFAFGYDRGGNIDSGMINSDTKTTVTKPIKLSYNSVVSCFTDSFDTVVVTSDGRLYFQGSQLQQTANSNGLISS